MSGDVQPRKRKDKRRRKDDGLGQEEPSIQQSASSGEDFNIHVHNDHGTGGGICAKLVFFALLSILAVLIGVIITQNRGSTELETDSSDSRFAKVFDGWLDESTNNHGDEDHTPSTFHDDDDYEEEEDTEHGDSGDEEQHESSEKELNNENEDDDDNEDEEEEEPIASEETHDQEDETENENVDNTKSNEDVNDSEEAEDNEDDVDNTADEDDNLNQIYSNEDEEDVTQDENTSQQNEILDEDSAEENEDLNYGDELEDEEVVDNTAGKDVLKEEVEQTQVEEESSSMAVKFGVGVALVVVAHIVLVRKWQTGKRDTDPCHQEDGEDSVTSEMSRRHTIVSLPPLEQIQQDIQNVEDDYSDEEDEDEEESEDDLIIDSITSKTNYQELHTTYSHALPSEIITRANITHEQQKFSYPREEYDEEEIEEEEEEEEDDDEDISDVDDEELLRKLEARYGKFSRGRENNFPGEKEELTDDKFESWKRIKVLPTNNIEDTEESDDETEWKQNVANSLTIEQQERINSAEANMQNNIELTLNTYTNLLRELPNNVHVKYGHARALDRMAEVKRSNEYLQEAITSYIELLQNPSISDDLFLTVGERCIDRIRFRGHYAKAVNIHKLMIDRFPNVPKHQNQLAVTLLTANRLTEAKNVLTEVLLHWPNDGFAQVHYGFILKTRDNDMAPAAQYLRAGIESRAPGVIDGRFYFHLGDALIRLGRVDEADKIHEDGVKHKVFLSKYQRSLYNVDRLKAQPWWPLNQTPYTPYFQLLEQNWIQIRDEALTLLNHAGYFKNEAENLRDRGEWKQFELYARGQQLTDNCKKCPMTCELIEQMPDAKRCRRGQIKFSVMHAGTHVWPHCGPSNCRLRAHLGLKIPNNTYIRVANETRSWQEGKVFLFDDSFEHEVWHNGTGTRLVLIVDVWHPELTTYEKRALPTI